MELVTLDKFTSVFMPTMLIIIIRRKGYLRHITYTKEVKEFAPYDRCGFVEIILIFSCLLGVCRVWNVLPQCPNLIEVSKE